MDGIARLGLLTAAVRALTQSVLGSAAATPPELRRAAFDGSPTDAAVAAYVDLVDRHADRVTDGELAALRERGLSDDEIFDVTVAAALGAARCCAESRALSLRPHGILVPCTRSAT